MKFRCGIIYIILIVSFSYKAHFIFELLSFKKYYAIPENRNKMWKTHFQRFVEKIVTENRNLKATCTWANLSNVKFSKYSRKKFLTSSQISYKSSIFDLIESLEELIVLKVIKIILLWLSRLLSKQCFVQIFDGR